MNKFLDMSNVLVADKALDNTWDRSRSLHRVLFMSNCENTKTGSQLKNVGPTAITIFACKAIQVFLHIAAVIVLGHNVSDVNMQKSGVSLTGDILKRHDIILSWGIQPHTGCCPIRAFAH